MKHPIRSLGAGVASAALLATAGAGVAGASTPPAPLPRIGVGAMTFGPHDVFLTEYGAKLPNGGPFAVVKQSTRYGYTSTTVGNSVGDSQPAMYCNLPGTTSCLLAIRDERTGATIAFDRAHLPAKPLPMAKAPPPATRPGVGPEHVSLGALLTWTPPNTPPNMFDPQALLTGGRTESGKMFADIGAEWGPRPLTADTLVVSHNFQVLGYFPGQDAEANVVGGSPGRWSEQLLTPSGRQLAEVSVVLPKLVTPTIDGPVVPPQGRAGLLNVSGYVNYNVTRSGVVSAKIDPGWFSYHVGATFPAGTTLELWRSVNGVNRPVWSKPASVDGGAANEPIVLRQPGVWALAWYIDGRAVSETMAVVPKEVSR